MKEDSIVKIKNNCSSNYYSTNEVEEEDFNSIEKVLSVDYMLDKNIEVVVIHHSISKNLVLKIY